MPYADLHVHTTRSDGQLTLKTVPSAAKRADVALVALTDHDRLQEFEQPVIERSGITIVHGIELRVETTAGNRYDLLGYGVTPTPALETELARIQRNRRRRAARIIDCVSDRLNIDLDLSIEDGIGRPHIARAIDANPDTTIDYTGAFYTLIGAGCPCYVPREIPSFEVGRQLLSEACILTSLAHPLRYGDPHTALELAGDLDAVELYYPYDREYQLDIVSNYIERESLLITGGSDAHDDRLGLAGLSQREYAALGLPVP